MKKDQLIGDICFDHVRFHYPSRPALSILNGVSFEARAGETIALVGSSGSGKSTCIQLLQRLYDADSGSITIDHTPIHEYNVRWLREQIGVVSQDSALFSGSVRENIAMGKDTASDDEIVAAAKMANAHGFIMNLPQVSACKSNF